MFNLKPKLNKGKITLLTSVLVGLLLTSLATLTFSGEKSSFSRWDNVQNQVSTSFQSKTEGLPTLSSQTASVIASLETTVGEVADGLNTLFHRYLLSPVLSLFDNEPEAITKIVDPDPAPLPAPRAPDEAPQNAPVSVTSNIIKTITNNQIVERTTERIIERVLPSDITKSYVDASIQALSNKLSSDLSKLSVGSGGPITNVYQQIAHSQRIDNLYNTVISNPTITNGTITGTSISSPAISIVDGSITNLSFTNATGTSATTTNFFSTTASSTNLFSSLLSVGGNALNVVAGGNVGIGSTTPGYKLSVAGSAYFDGGTVIASNLIATSSISAPSFTITGVAINSLLSTNSSGAIVATSTPTFGNFNATSTNATSTISGGLAIETSGFVYDYSTNFVGIGTASPDSHLTINGNGSALPAVPYTGTNIHLGGANSGQLSVIMDGFGAAPLLIGRRAQGTAASPSSVNFSGYNLLVLSSSGYGATTYGEPQANISVRTAQGWTDSAQGTSLYFSTTGNGETVSSDRWQISDSGHLVGVTDNTYDIGASGATRPRTGYFGTSVVTPLLTATNFTTTNSTTTNSTTTNAFVSSLVASNATTTNLYFSNNLTGPGSFTVNSSGNVGIGTTTPAGKLEVMKLGDASATNYGVHSTVTGGANATNIAGYFTASGASSNFAVRTGLGDIYLNGYTTINGIIDAHSSYSSTKGNIFIGDTTSGFIAGNGGGLVFAGDTLGQGSANTTFANIRGVKENGTYNNSLGALIFGTQSNSGSQQVLSTVTEKMRITSSGNVGIGTTNPNYKLEVSGTGRFSGLVDAANFVATSTSVSSSFGYRVGIGIAGPGTALQVEQGSVYANAVQSDTVFNGTASANTTSNLIGSDAYWAIRTAINNSYNLDVYNAGTSLAAMTVLQSGNVGIGTPNPGAKLDISHANTQAGLDIYNTSNSSAKTFSFTTSSNNGRQIINDNTGTARVVLDSGSSSYFTGGNVGIGTTTPRGWLNIKALNNDSASQLYLEQYNDDRGWTFNAKADGHLHISSSYLGTDTERLTFQYDTGNVGIGTTTPLAKLSVNSTDESRVAIFRNSSAAESAETNLLLTTGDPSKGQGVIAWKNRDVAATYLSQLQFRTSGSNTEPTVRMVVNEQGRVGIGTIAPTYMLHVYGTGGSQATEGRLAADGPTSSAPGISFLSAGVEQWVLYRAGTSEDLRIFSGGDKFTFKQTGRLGIGETLPGSMLSVSGNASVGASYDTVAAPTDGLIVEGSVGIGNSSPDTKLMVNGTSAAGTPGTEEIFKIARVVTPTVAYPQVASFALGTYSTNSSGNSFGPDTRLDIKLKSLSSDNYTTDFTVMSLLDNGNVGIGTTNPAELLEVKTTSVSSTNNALKITSSAANIGTGIKFEGHSGGGVANSGRIYSVFDSSTYATARISLQTPSNENTWVDALTAKDGKIGIGTTTPNSLLNIAGEGATVRIDTTSTASAGTNIFNSVGVLKASFGYSPTSDVLFAGYGGNTHLNINSSGNVGIGTTSPNGKLTVYGDSQRLLMDAATAGGQTGILMQGNGGALYKSEILHDTGNLALRTTQNGTLATRLYISGDAGSVGIGTTDPGSILDVRKDASGALGADLNLSNLTTSSPLNTSSGVTGYLADSSGIRRESGRIQFASNRVGGWGASGTWDSAMRFWTNNGSGLAERMTILHNGFVGIGTTDPQRRLEVVDNTAGYSATIFNDGNLSTRAGLWIQVGTDDASGTNDAIRFTDGDGTTQGSVTFSAGVTSYNTSSDIRLKSNIQKTSFSLTDLMQIEVRDYSFISDPTNKIHTGFIAQQLYGIYPNVVTVPNNTEDMWSVDYGKLTPLLVSAVQEIGNISGLFKDTLITWFADTKNGITKFFAKEIYTEKLCVKKSDGTDVCVTGDELALILAGSPSQTTTSSSSSGSATTSDPVPAPTDSTATSTPTTSTSETSTTTPETATPASTEPTSPTSPESPIVQPEETLPPPEEPAPQPTPETTP